MKNLFITIQMGENEGKFIKATFNIINLIEKQKLLLRLANETHSGVSPATGRSPSGVYEMTLIVKNKLDLRQIETLMRTRADISNEPQNG